MQGQTNPSILRPRLQRRLRHQATEAERLLWQHLRDRQFGGCKFRRQHVFGDYVLDFACLDHKLVIELDGGQHAEQAAAARDALRTTVLHKAGFRVRRYWNDQVFGELTAVLEDIWRALGVEGNPSPPRPSP